MQRDNNIFSFLHLVLAPVFFIAFLLSHNYEEGVSWLSVLVAYGVVQVLFLAMFGVCWLLARNAALAGILTTCSLFVFLSYDIFARFFPDSLVATAAWAVVQLLVFFIIVRKKIDSPKVSSALTAVFLCLSILNLYSPLVRAFTHEGNTLVDARKEALFAAGAGEKTAAARPIYHIYLDALGRGDVLREMYGVDDLDIESELEKLGFYVAKQSLANYNQTDFSLISTINVNYIQEFIPKEKASNRNLLNAFVNSFIFTQLKEQGYRIVVFENGGYGSYLKQAADEYVDANKGASLLQGGGLDYVRLLIKKTMLSAVRFGEQSLAETLFSNQRKNTVLNTLHELGNLGARVGKHYYFIHIISPHPPFVFDENGGDLVDEMAMGIMSDGSHYTHGEPERIANYKKLYARQVRYILKQTLAALKKIQAESPVQPIIILQSDHGPGSEYDVNSKDRSNLRERMSILNAYYFPEAQNPGLYPTISPVNSYRVLFNAYFNTNAPLVEDNAFFSTWDAPFDFINVTQEARRTE